MDPNLTQIIIILILSLPFFFLRISLNHNDSFIIYYLNLTYGVYFLFMYFIVFKIIKLSILKDVFKSYILLGTK
jgi:hypothetical protein